MIEEGATVYVLSAAVRDRLHLRQAVGRGLLASGERLDARFQLLLTKAIAEGLYRRHVRILEGGGTQDDSLHRGQG